MAETHTIARSPGVAYAVSDTGPLISAFQSGSLGLLASVFAAIYIPQACMTELEQHGWEEEVQSAILQLAVVRLNPKEEEYALELADQIAQHSNTRDPVLEHHIGEAQAIVVALRPEHRADLLLLDELAARAVARQAELKLSGFPGALLLATQLGLISAEELRVRLDTCREKGTHYGEAFIQEVYEMAQMGRRQR